VREAALKDDEQDRLLHAAFCAGDPRAFDQLVRRHQERVRRLAWRLLGWRADVDDVVQDVFFAAFKRLGRFRGESSVSTWLTTITINVCRSYQRRQKLRLRWWRNAVKQPAGSALLDAPIEARETSQRVRRAIKKLPPRDREVIVLYYLEELSTKQIATILGSSGNAVDLRLHRARQRLKPMLADFT
jgi:RNA polymerase sigma-70 factor (ECF subfamily)